MKYSLKIFTILGIPVELHFSFILLMAFIYVIAFLKLVPGINLQTAILITLLFVTVVLHELSHSYLAQRYGIRIERIVLLPIGGVSAMEEIPSDPGQELRISLAGPLVNFLIAALCYPLLLILGRSYPYLSAFISYFILVNLILGAFNLLPAFPMDGGRVLRAYLAERMNYIRATELAASVGKQLAIIMAIVGILILRNPFLILVAIFVYIGADQEYQTVLISRLLGEMRVEEIMSPEVTTVTPENTVKEVLEIMFQEKHMGYPVLEGNNPIGIVTFHDLSRVAEKDKDKQISQFMSSDLVVTSPNEPLTDALEKLNQNKVGRLPVLEKGKLVGIVSRTDVMRALEIMKLKSV
jgi:Zn-dependent protease/CBS domain-containing protein